MSESAGGKRPPGRPRCERARQAILSSTLKFLEAKENGFADLTIEALAIRSLCRKSHGVPLVAQQGALVADAFASRVTQKLGFPDTAPYPRT